VLLDVILPLLLSLADFKGDVRPVLDSQIQLTKWIASKEAAKANRGSPPPQPPTPPHAAR